MAGPGKPRTIISEAQAKEIARLVNRGLTRMQARWRVFTPEQRIAFNILVKDGRRRKNAKLGGYEPPPRERDCPPRPSDNRCELCNCVYNSYRVLHLDHDHVTGRFRGWLCNRCNSMLGNVEAIGIINIKRYLARKRKNYG